MRPLERAGVYGGLALLAGFFANHDHERVVVAALAADQAHVGLGPCVEAALRA